MVWAWDPVAQAQGWHSLAELLAQHVPQPVLPAKINGHDATKPTGPIKPPVPRHRRSTPKPRAQRA